MIVQAHSDIYLHQLKRPPGLLSLFKENQQKSFCLSSQFRSGRKKKRLPPLGRSLKLKSISFGGLKFQECSYPMLTKYMLNFAILFIHSKVVFDLIYYFDLTKEDSEEMAFLLSQR